MATVAPVLVIGAGVIGLSTAVILAEAGYPVVVRAAEPPEVTTSAMAGALWGPWLVQPRHRVLRWAEHTLTTLRHLAPQLRSRGSRRQPLLGLRQRDHRPDQHRNIPAWRIPPIRAVGSARLPATLTLSSGDTAAAYTRDAGSPARPACLLDPVGGGAYRRPEDRADITLILQMRLRVLPRRGEQELSENRRGAGSDEEGRTVLHSDGAGLHSGGAGGDRFDSEGVRG